MPNAPEGSVIITAKFDSRGIKAGVADATKTYNDLAITARRIGDEINGAFAGANMTPPPSAAEEYKAINEQIEQAEKDLNRAIEKKEKFLATGGDTTSKTYAGMQYEIENIQRVLEEARVEKEQLEQSGALNMSVDESGVSEATEKVDQLGKTAQKSTKPVRNLGKAVAAVTKNMKKSSSGFSGSLKTLLKYTLGIRSLFVLFNRLRAAVKEGMNNLVQFDSTVNDSMSSVTSGFTRLKNATATAFAPLLNVAAPIIRDISDRLSDLATSIGMFFAALTGQKEFTRAVAVQEDYAQSLEKTAEAAKYLSGLDEIKTYNPNGAIGPGDVSTTDMFETVEIPSAFEVVVTKVRDILSRIQKDVSAFGQHLYTSFTTWADNLDWTPLKTSVDSLMLKLEPLVSLISDGLKWAYDNVLLPFGSWTIEDAIPAVLNTLGTALQFIADVGKAAEPTLKAIWDNFFAPAATFIGEAFIDTITAIGNFLQLIIDDEDAITMLSDLAIAIGAVVAATKLWEAAQLALNTALDANPIGAVIALLALLIPLLVEVDKHWDEIYSGFVDFDEWLTGQLTHDWTDTFGILGGGANALCDVIHGVYIFIRDTLGGLAEFLEGVFTGNWNKIWHGLGTVVSGVVKGILLVIVGVVNAVIWAINLLWEGVYSVIKGIVDGIGGIAGALGSLFGQDWSFSMPSDVPKIPYIPTDWADIPWLAKGAVIPPNAPFTAVLGDQRHGTNIEAPLETIKDAVRQVLAERGGESGGGENVYRFTAQIGRRVVFDEIITEAKLRQSATGRNPFALA